MKELAEGGRIMIRTDVGEEPEDIFDYVSGIHRNFGEKITHSIVYSPEIQSDDPEYWGNISEILGLKNDVEFAWTFEKDVEGNAEEASAAEKITYSTWCEENSWTSSALETNGNQTSTLAKATTTRNSWTSQRKT